MPQKPLTFTEKLQKSLRGFKRQLKLLTSDSGAFLRNATESVMLKGPDEDIRKLKGLDLQIGALMAPFNGVARVPEKVTAEIDRHVKDVEASFKRVAATKIQNVATADFGLVRVTTAETFGTPVRDIEYVSTYTSPSGGKIDQRLLKARLG